MSAAVLMRAIIVVPLADNRKALPGQRFTTTLAHAEQLLRQGAAVVVNEPDIAKIAGRELMHRHVRGYFGGRGSA